MRLIRRIITILFICSLPLMNLNAGLVYFANINKKQCGFIAKSGEDFYAYTSQSALLSLGRFAVKSFDGTSLQSSGSLELSYNSDIARIKIDPGKLKDQAFEIGGNVKMGGDVEVYSVSLSDNIDSKGKTKVKGVGMYSFAIDKETDFDSAGTPVLSDNKVVGVLSKGYEEFEVASHWNEGKVKIVEKKNKTGARLDVEVNWVPAEKVGFDRAGEELADAQKFQSEFLPILNFWCANPYRELPEDIKYPKDLQSWVNDFKYKTKAYDKLVPRSKDLNDKKGLVDSLMEGTLERSMKLSKFPQNKVRQMKISWKTPYLRSRAGTYMTNWRKIDKLMECRLVNMEYMVPTSFTPDGPESGNKKK